MQSNITQKRVKGFFGMTFLTLFFLSFFAGIANAQVYTNGVLSTGATAANGTVAPAGFTWSEAQSSGAIANSTGGVGAQITAGNSVADDFIVPAGPSWNVTKVTVYAYSTGAAATPSPFTDLRVRIHSSSPLAGPTTVVFGDLTTNRLSSSTTANVYRIFNTLIPVSATTTTRQVWKLEANINVTLAPGTYWLEFQTGTALASNFVPTSSPLGVRTLPGYNAIQNTAGAWAALVDGGVNSAGTGAGANVAVDLPFQIAYTTGPCAGTPAPGNTLTSATAVCPSIPFTLSLQNQTNGSGVTYAWESSPTVGGTYTPIAGATSSTLTVNNLAATAFYRAVVTCSGSSGTSTPVQVSLNPPSACYCTPAASDCTDGDVLLNVTLGTLNNNSTCSPSGYANYTLTPGINVPDVIIGATNNIKVTLDVPFLLPENAAVWIDYNKNGNFEASEFTLIGASATGGVVTNNINVPSTALAGTTRMRVRCRWSTAILATDACTTFAYGETEDYTVNLVPCVPVTLTTQPTNKTISCGDNTTFTVAATGSLPAFYWEYRPDATSVWVNVPNAAPFSGVNTATLTVSNASAALNGYQFRAVFSGACTGVDFSNAASLTVNPFAPILAPAASAAICKGSITQFSINNVSLPVTSPYISSGPLNITIPDNNVYGDGDNVGINNTINVTTIPAAALVTGLSIRMNIVHSWVGDLIVVLKAPNGKIYNMDYVLTGTGGSVATTGFTNTIISSAGTVALSTGSSPYTGTFRPDNITTAIPDIPLGPAGFIPNTSVLSDLLANGANGQWTIALYDYYDDLTTTNKLTDWAISFTYGAPQTGIFTPSTGLFTDAAATVPYTGTPVSTIYASPAVSTTYSLVVTNATCVSSALSIPVTVSAPATAVTPVASKSICPLGTTTFTATATGGATNTYQWQVSTDAGATFTAVANGGVYSGATTNTLTITGATQSLSGNQYRVAVGAAPCAGVLNSTAGTLTITPNPVLNLAAAPTTAVFPGITTSVVVAVNPAPTTSTTYAWTYNGAPLAGATTNTVTGIGVDALGTYSVKVTDGNGCSATSASITIRDSATTTLFVYPNPSTGQFHVRYHDENTSPTFQGPRTLTIFDSKGSRVYWKTYPISAAYSDMFVDLRNHGKGVYTIDLTDFNGNRIKTGRIIIK